jgi:hypothetical protein
MPVMSQWLPKRLVAARTLSASWSLHSGICLPVSQYRVHGGETDLVGCFAGLISRRGALGLAAAAARRRDFIKERRLALDETAVALLVAHVRSV